MILTIFWVVHSLIYWLLMVNTFFIFKKIFGDHSTRLLFRLRTHDKLFLFWIVPNMMFAGFIGNMFFGALAIWTIYRLAKNNYPDDDDDTHGKRLLSWGKSHIPKPYVQPIPIPI